ncbi:adenylate/guanylate cyclase domain-containing protein [Noviherbaspirillum agri]
MLRALADSLRRSPLRLHAALAVLFVALLGIELSGLRAFASMESRLGDVFMRRHATDMAADPGIVIVDVDDASIIAMQEIAGLWSWPREIHADLIEALAEFQPRAIVFDITFAERDLKRPKSDARLSDALRANPHAYLAAVQMPPAHETPGTPVGELASAFDIAATGKADASASLQLPLAVERDAWRLGLINASPDTDGVLRRYRTFSEVGGWRLPSLPARVAGDLGVSLPASEEFVMRWPAGGHKRYAYSELYRLLTEQRPTLGADDLRTLDSLFRDKVVVIGSSAAGAFDHHLTPLGAGYPGVDVLALAIDNLKNGRSVHLAHPAIPFLLGSGFIAMLAVAFSRHINPLLVGGGLALASLLMLALADVALGRGYLLPVATPLIFAWAWFLCAALAGFLRERRAREQAVALFRRFLNPNVVQQIVEQGETVESLSGRTRDITVLFSDIRGFTTLSETRPPHEVVALLNRYFELQVEVVFRHGGTLDKFIGDAIMAFWGAPLDDPDHARRAVAAALEMEQVLLAFRRLLEGEGSDVGDFDVGIGVHTGPAVVGFIGAQRKLDYTAIGDTVNLASRVEGLTRGVGRVLVTRETMLACDGDPQFAFRHRGAFDVKGRTAAVDLYEPERTTT